jgi:hypothetical protein
MIILNGYKLSIRRLATIEAFEMVLVKYTNYNL